MSREKEPSKIELPDKEAEPLTPILVSAVTATAIFLFDLLLPLGIAAGVPYVALVLVGMWFRQPKTILYLAAVGSTLTIAGYFLSPELGIPWMVFTNRALAFFAIWASAILAYQSKLRELALVNAGRELEARVVQRTADLTREMDERQQAEQKARKLQDDLARICRMSEVVETTTVFAHELNQPLSVISSYAQGLVGGLKERDKDDDNLIVAAERIQEQAARASEVIKKTRDLLLNEKTHRSQIDVNRCIGSVLHLMESDIKEQNVKVVTSFSAQELAISAVPVQIQQVLINLIRNGLEAYDETEVKEKRLVIGSGSDGNGMVEITVHDNGKGIDGIEARDIFRPFFTTKGDGLGMGLSISHSIIESHGGNLWYEQPEEGGARFHVRLPKASE